MQDERNSGAAQGSAKAMRQERLARALRDNLRRRKARSRADGPMPDDALPSGDPAPPLGGEA